MFAFCLLALAAAEPQPLAQGVDLYERGLYEKSRAALSKALDLPLPDADKNRARLYLAADYFALGDRRGALYALEDLARKAPEQTIDPSVFPPDFIELWKQARSQVEAERASAPAPTPAPEPPQTEALPAAPPEPSPQPGAEAAPGNRPLWLVALVPAAAAIGFGIWGIVSWSRTGSLHGQLTGSNPPALLADGEAIAQQGRAANRDAVIGFTVFAAAAALALALGLLLGRL